MSMALTTLQKKAIAALLSTRTVEQAAEKAGCSDRAIYGWPAKDEAFKRELAVAEGQAIDRATRQLIALQDGAISVFVQILANREASDSVRLRAAQSILDYLLKLRELRNVESRLAKLEAQLAERD